jgi:GntR family transcriptional regulator, transcriptional repressor for pyruvate dehydrogenase complex
MGFQSTRGLTAMKLDAISSQKGFETLAGLLKEQILNGAIQIGDVINERDLIERSGLSRGSVREALRVLETQGLVSTRRGRNGGSVASRTGAGVVHSLLNDFIRGQRVPLTTLLETIQLLEPSLAELAALHRDHNDIAALKLAMKKLADTTSAKRFVAANAEWHSAIAHASHNLIMTTIYDALGPGLLDPRVAGFVSTEVREAVLVAGEKILEAIVKGDAVAARRRMDRHVRAYREMIERLAPKTVTI